MARPARILVALGALMVLVLVIAACGSGVPGNAVARIGDQSVTKAQFDHLFTVRNRQIQGAQPGRPVPVPDPPDYKKCVADKLKKAPKPAKGQPNPSAAQFRQQCEYLYKALRDDVLQTLIQFSWISQEAAARGIKVTRQDALNLLAQRKKAAHETEAQFQRGLRASNQSLEDLLFGYRLDLLSSKLRAEAIKGTERVTPAQIAAYYNAHRQQYAQPERRDIFIVLTQTRARALQALAALHAGQSFKQVARRYSIDQQTKASGGLLQGIPKGTQDRALDRAAFSAPKGRLGGPIKATFGYYLYEVKRITPATQQTLAQVQPAVRAQLIIERQQKAIANLVNTVDNKWRAKTTCRTGYVIALCKNAPKPKTVPGQTTPLPQGAPSNPTPGS